MSLAGSFPREQIVRVGMNYAPELLQGAHWIVENPENKTGALKQFYECPMNSCRSLHRGNPTCEGLSVKDPASQESLKPLKLLFVVKSLLEVEGSSCRADEGPVH